MTRKPLIRDLTIERYRTFQHLKIEGLGRVNLITGRNNTGKSSLLEAVRILAFNASPHVLYDIIRFREEDTGDGQDTQRGAAGGSTFELSSLFYGFPAFAADLEPTRIVADGEARSMTLSLGMAWLAADRDAEGAPLRLREQMQADLFSTDDVVPGLVIEADGVRRMRALDSMRRIARNRLPQPSSLPERKLPCSFVTAYGGEETATLSQLWDTIALSELEADVVAALQIIDPQITAVSMIGGDIYGKGRTAIVRQASWPRPVPLRSFGDSVNRLFGIVLSLVTAKDGLLLIDEVENGLHHSVQYDVWKTIFALAQRLNVQVLATSHSWDTIEAFQKAAGETPEDGVLVRLLRRGDDVIATVFDEEDLRIVTRDKIEVR
jgi:energy-coupling factor transporter ATP-binding protein EcfA2